MCGSRLHHRQARPIPSCVGQRGIYPRDSEQKGIPQVDLADPENVGLPALIFSSMVTAFTPENISAFGSLAIVAILYQSLGISMAWLVRELFFVPIDFRWGILVVSRA